MKSLPHKDVFTAINGQMIASLADNQRTDEARTSNAFLNRPFGQRRHRDSTLPAGASILLSMMIVNMELSRLQINATENHRCHVPHSSHLYQITNLSPSQKIAFMESRR
jgi:hypothetical protein